MPNGKIGDHPITEILIHKQRVFSKAIDGLILEIIQLGARRLLEERFDWFSSPPKDFEKQLTALRDQLKTGAKTRGWEIE